MDPSFPPLKGDGQGRYKVHITGNSGTGKSTLGVELASILGVPYISLDRLFWRPGWEKTPETEFRTKIREALNQDDRGWIVDGNYRSRGAGFVSDECTDLIWLDPPLLLYFPRVAVRTLLRLLDLRPTCSPGCPETVREAFFSSNSILWWCLSNHWAHRRLGEKKMLEIGLGLRRDRPGQKMRRIGGWGSELRRWLKEVEEMSRRA